MHPTKISTKTEKDGFMHTVFEIRTKKIPSLNFIGFVALVFCFLWANLCEE